jgi:tetratricopeptide (TPR) repeat protein
LPAPSAAAPPTSPKAPRVFDAMAERRFALERARAEQRRYHLAEAEQFYARILARSPHDSEALAGLGELELLRGTTDLAAARFRDALSANADYVPARIAVADLEWQAGHVEAARQAYREIVQAYTADLYPPYVAQRSQVGEPANCDP